MTMDNPVLLNETMKISPPRNPYSATISREDKEVSSKRKRPNITIAVFGGGEGSTLKYFQAAMGVFLGEHPLANIIIDYKTNKDVRENKCGTLESPKDLVQWLRNSCAYFIVSQGIWLGMINTGLRVVGSWTVSGIESALKSIESDKNARGYPSAPQLSGCPIWNGDKMKYIDLIPEFTIPSMRIDVEEYKERFDTYVTSIHR